MTTLTTHDTKRGEDVRARIGVLSQVPSLWAEFVARWETIDPSPDPATGLFLWQNIFGVWPASGEVTDELRDRLHAYGEKAIREAAWHTSGTTRTPTSRDAVHRWLDAVLDGPVARELTNLVIRLQPHAESDALGQKLLALTVPGIPDVYQGTELWDDSLVDPDNRRAGGLRRPTSSIEVFAAPENSRRQSGLAAAPRPSGHLPAGRLSSGARRRNARPIMWWRSGAVTTCWSR